MPSLPRFSASQLLPGVCTALSAMHSRLVALTAPMPVISRPGMTDWSQPDQNLPTPHVHLPDLVMWLWSTAMASRSDGSENTFLARSVL